MSDPDAVLIGRTMMTRAADAAGVLAAERRLAGRPVEIRDVQIAGIVTANRATLATRNTRHFEGLGLPLIDPWAMAAPDS